MPSSPAAVTLPQHAFPPHANPARYFPAASIEAARSRLVQCLLRGDGPSLVIGAPGIGKTMLLETLAAEVGDRLRVVRLAGAQLCTRRALLQAILHGLEAPYRDRDEGELRLSLADRLADHSQTGDGVALLVDEAQTLPLRLLEELRLLANTAVAGSPRVRLVLAGTNALDEAFTAPEFEAFSQRLAVRSYLEPLSRAETAQYVRAHLAAAGADPDRLLTPDAYEALLLASNGMPRLLNQVADRALTMASEAGLTSIDGRMINDAWSDLHRLAAPWQAPASSPLVAAEPAASTPESDSIEYGVLDDEAFADQEFSGACQEEEACPSLQLPTTTEPDDGVWDAGDKLRELGKTLSELSDAYLDAESDAADEEDDLDGDECVAYAFPGINAAPPVEEPTAEEQPADAVDHDDALQDVKDLLEEASRLTEAPAPRRPSASADTNPFAEDFDEEEIVVDPYAELERVIPAALSVRPLERSELSEALASLEALTEDATSAAQPVEADAARSAWTVETRTPAEAASTATTNDPLTDEGPTDDGVLVVELDDEITIDQPTARRQEYDQLFANLRQG